MEPLSCTSIPKVPLLVPAYDECKALSTGYGPSDGCFVYDGKRYRYKEHSTLAFNSARDAGIVELLDKCDGPVLTTGTLNPAQLFINSDGLVSLTDTFIQKLRG